MSRDYILGRVRSALAVSSSDSDLRVRFMLEMLIAIRNNNVKKIPNYDSEHQQELLRTMRQQWFRPGKQSSPLRVSLADLTEAGSRGRWWIVGSAWKGKEEGEQLGWWVNRNPGK